MTCHIALSHGETAILISDSQGSDESSEQHGLEKQFAGPDFLLGIAGLGPVRAELFGRLEDAIRPGPNQLEAKGLQPFLEQFIETEIRPEARKQIEFITVTPPDSGGNMVQTFAPGVFARMGRRQSSGFIGSGAEFVHRAISAYDRLGISHSFLSLADLIVAGEDFAKAADESLTVNDSFLLGIIVKHRSYLMGDETIRPEHAPEPLKQQWTQAASRFRNLMRVAREINGELRQVQKLLSAIRIGDMTQANLDANRNSNDTLIAPQRLILAQHLGDYLLWYDGILGRP